MVLEKDRKVGSIYGDTEFPDALYVCKEVERTTDEWGNFLIVSHTITPAEAEWVNLKKITSYNASAAKKHHIIMRLFR